ncbi:MAG: hypothetical protein J0L92_36965, partial [Deltaproteobacteria bacterium]|nr:hypothetical protein [Deltaproteobacteria bacterium]
DPAPGYACFGGAGIGVRGVLAAWAPGAGAVLLPEGVGIDPGRGPLVIQIHYNTLTSDGRADRTRVRLASAASASTSVRILPLADASLSLPPRQPLVSTSHEVGVASSPLVTRPFQVFGVYPHMHTLGRALHAEVRHADGSTECLLDVPRWDFDWQLFYLRERPLTIREDDTLVLRCDYDTTSRDETVRWGEGTADEMCLVGLLVDL